MMNIIRHRFSAGMYKVKFGSQKPKNPTYHTLPFRVHSHSAETDIHYFYWTRNFNTKLLTDFSIHPLSEPFKSSQNL
jgi:hypothetical protein